MPAHGKSPPPCITVHLVTIEYRVVDQWFGPADFPAIRNISPQPLNVREKTVPAI